MKIFRWVQSGIDRQVKHLRDDGVFLGEAPSDAELAPHEIIDVDEVDVPQHGQINAALQKTKKLQEDDFERRKAEKMRKAGL